MIGLILPGTLKYCPYIQYYIRALDDRGIPFEILSWDKVGLHEDVAHAFHYQSRDRQMIRKTMGYFRFRSWVMEICERQQYDKLIVFTLAPALLLGNYLLKKYAGRYYLDIRDDTVLRRFLGRRIQKLINGASGIVSSSRAFDGWICRDSLICHNVDPQPVRDALERGACPGRGRTPADGVNRIMFAGALNEWAINLELVKLYANDPAFEYAYHAPDSAGKRTMMDACTANQIRNVRFHGAYRKEDIYEMYRNEADWVNIIRCESEVNRNALPNKLYDAMVAGVPVIVLSHNRAVCDYVERYGLGLVFDGIEDMKARFQQEVDRFDDARFAEGRMAFLREVLDAAATFEETLVRWAQS